MRHETLEGHVTFDDKAQYVLRSHGRGIIPQYFTGLLAERVRFDNGIAHVRTLFDYRICVMRGCEDVTPKENREALKGRDLRRILVIRDAAFGDVTIITPGLLALRKKYPEALIHFYGRTDSRQVLENLGLIDGILDCRERELGSMVDSYDEVFDLVNTIECCPKADYLNSLDVLEEFLGVKCEENEKLPLYNLSKHEVDEGLKLLRQLGIDPSHDEILLFQGEATARARTFVPIQTLRILYHFHKRGFRLLHAGHRTDILEHLLLLEEPSKKTLQNRPPTFTSMTRKEVIDLLRAGKGTLSKKALDEGLTPDSLVGEGGVALTKPGGILDEATVVIKNHEGEDATYRVLDFPLVSNAAFLGKVPARHLFAMAFFAKFMITVDSFYSHLGAALQKPQVVVFSNYHPVTRAKYYPRAIVVAPRYAEVVPCGPCNAIFDNCKLYPDRQPQCIGSIDPVEVIAAGELLLQGVIPLHQPLRDGNVAQWNPLWDETFLPATAKGPYIYAFDKETGSLHRMGTKPPALLGPLYEASEAEAPELPIPNVLHKQPLWRNQRNAPVQEVLGSLEMARKGLGTALWYDIEGPVGDEIVGRTADRKSGFRGAANIRQVPSVQMLLRAVAEAKASEDLAKAGEGAISDSPPTPSASSSAPAPAPAYIDGNLLLVQNLEEKSALVEGQDGSLQVSIEAPFFKALKDAASLLAPGAYLAAVVGAADLIRDPNASELLLQPIAGTLALAPSRAFLRKYFGWQTTPPAVETGIPLKLVEISTGPGHFLLLFEKG